MRKNFRLENSWENIFGLTIHEKKFLTWKIVRKVSWEKFLTWKLVRKNFWFEKSREKFTKKNFDFKIVNSSLFPSSFCFFSLPFSFDIFHYRPDFPRNNLQLQPADKRSTTSLFPGFNFFSSRSQIKLIGTAWLIKVATYRNQFWRIGKPEIR